MIVRAIAKALFGFGSWRRLVAPVGGLALIVVAVNAIDYTLNPWAYAWSGQRSLVGYWQGEIVYEAGDRRQIVLHLTRDLWDLDDTRSRGSRSNIEGGAKICGPIGNLRYGIRGITHDRRGTRFTLGFGSDKPTAGKHLNAIHGMWAGDDKLALQTTLYTIGPDGVGRAVASADAQATPSDRAPQVVFELRRTSQDTFDSACPADGQADDESR
jgi:hypothetical protein